jgi:hypothetical protein
MLEKRKNPSKKKQSNLGDAKSQESSSIRKYVRGMNYTLFDAELNADSESAYSIPRTCLRREQNPIKISIKRRRPQITGIIDHKEVCPGHELYTIRRRIKC